MSVFLYNKVICPKCGKDFPVKPHQKVIHIVRIGNKKLMKCPHCVKWSMCKGQS